MKNLYYEYFAKDKPARHYTQHLLTHTIGLLLIYLMARQILPLAVILYFVFSYLVDLDAVITLLIFRKRYRILIEGVYKNFRQGGMIQLATFLTKNHKKINTLLFHNIIGFTIVTLGFVIAWVYLQFPLFVYIYYIVGGILIHMIHDIFDDIFILGNINNWLWPFDVKWKNEYRVGN